jgi:hypothetical protein
MESGNEPAVPGDEATVTGTDAAPPSDGADGAPPSDGAAATAANEGPPGVGTDMPSRRTSILRASVIVGVLVVVFGIILPKVVDYSEVRDALAALTFIQFVQISIFGFIAWVACGVLFCVVIPVCRSSAAPRRI